MSSPEAQQIQKLQQELVAQLIDKLNGQVEQNAKLLAHVTMVDTAKLYATSVLPKPDENGEITFKKVGHKYTTAIEAFIRKGATLCRRFSICRSINNWAFHFYPGDFFNDLIKYCYETDNPEGMITSLALSLSLEDPASWPTVLVQLHGAELGLVTAEQMKAEGVPATLKEEKVDYYAKVVCYKMGNKYKPEVSYTLFIHFEGDNAKCYQQMTAFELTVENAKKLAHWEGIEKAKMYRRTLPAYGELRNGHKYTPEIEAYVRYGASHCRSGGFHIWRGTDNAFSDYPGNFFDDIIKYLYETESPMEIIPDLIIQLPLNKPAPWPNVLVQLHAAGLGLIDEEQKKADGVPATLKEEDIDHNNNGVCYFMRNKNNPAIAFIIWIYFEGEHGKMYKQMTQFIVAREI